MADSLSVAALHQALRDVGDRHGDELRKALLGTFVVIAAEAARSTDFAESLASVWRVNPAVPDHRPPGTASTGGRTRSNRAAPLVDPFEVYSVSGEDGLVRQLSALNSGQLKDIVAHYALDHDGKAMGWRKIDRLIDRIVQNVGTRAAKGTSLR